MIQNIIFSHPFQHFSRASSAVPDFLVYCFVTWLVTGLKLARNSKAKNQPLVVFVWLRVILTDPGHFDPNHSGPIQFSLFQLKVPSLSWRGTTIRCKNNWALLNVLVKYYQSVNLLLIIVSCTQNLLHILWNLVQSFNSLSMNLFNKGLGKIFSGAGGGRGRGHGAGAKGHGTLFYRFKAWDGYLFAISSHGADTFFVEDTIMLLDLPSGFPYFIFVGRFCL